MRATSDLMARALAGEHFRGLLEALPVPSRVIQNGVVVFSNSADAALFGYESGADIRGTDAFAYVADEDLPRLRDYTRRRALGEPVPTRYAANAKHRDATVIPVEIVVARIIHAGQPASLLVIHDLRERR